VAHAERIQIPDATLRIDSVPAAGYDLALDVAGEIRAAMARRLGVTSVDRLEARLRAVRFRGGFRVSGHLEAEITQPSVISLEPVHQRIAEPIDRVFLPGGEKDYAGPANAEVFVDLEGDDLPDHFEGGEADLSELIIETLALAIDPYPRAEGESIDDMGVEKDAGGDHPFAGLSRLRGPSGDR
jgi:uncharacterized metal-binding protein YceD (DUF177 family)